MTWLLDTNVISALAPSRADRPQHLIDWIDCESDRLCVSVITAAEVRNVLNK